VSEYIHCEMPRCPNRATVRVAAVERPVFYYVCEADEALAETCVLEDCERHYGMKPGAATVDFQSLAASSSATAEPTGDIAGTQSLAPSGDSRKDDLSTSEEGAT
jgi:hypothetical protein